MAEFNEREFDGESFVTRRAVIDIAGIEDVECGKEPNGTAYLRLCGIAFLDGIAGLEQVDGLGIFADEHITQVLRKSCDEMRGIEAVVEHIIEEQECSRYIMAQRMFHQREIVVGIEDIEHLDRTFVGDVRTAESDQLVEDREGITHTSICFLSDHVQCFLIGCDTFVRRHFLQISDGVGHGDAVEVIDLTTTEDRGDHLMLLRRSEDEDGV